MGLFSHKKKNSMAEPSSATLEEILKRAALEPAYRAEFYKKLPTSDLIVLTQGSDIPFGAHTLEEESQINIVTLSDGRIPVFTSTDRIFDQNVVTEEVQYVSMNAIDLFKTVSGATLVVNPYSDYGKELLPEEIAKVLDGTILDRGERITIQQDTEVMLGQPAKVPHEMLDALKKVFVRHPRVKKAYLGWIASKDLPPHYVIGVETEEYTSELLNEAGFTAQQFLKDEELVDFVEVNDSAGVSGYLRSTDPFYRR